MSSSYQVLARKWRPHDFETIVGQDHVVTALTRALDGKALASCLSLYGYAWCG